MQGSCGLEIGLVGSLVYLCGIFADGGLGFEGGLDVVEDFFGVSG